MQNKTLILLGALVLSTTSLVSPARAQEAAPAVQPSEVSQAAQEQVVVPTEEKTKVVDEMLKMLILIRIKLLISLFVLH